MWPVKQIGAFAVAAADGRDEARARVGELVVRDAKARALEEASEMARARALHPGGLMVL
jgi:hypothetical protein